MWIQLIQSSSQTTQASCFYFIQTVSEFWGVICGVMPSVKLYKVKHDVLVLMEVTFWFNIPENIAGYPTFKGQVLNGQQLWELIEGLEENDLLYYTHLLTGILNYSWIGFEDLVLYKMVTIKWMCYSDFLPLEVTKKREKRRRRVKPNA